MNKFKTLLENNFTRFQGGGFLTGDLVKLKSDAANSDWAKKQPENLLAKLREFIDTDEVIRVSSVKAQRPQTHGGFQQHLITDGFYCDIVREKAPGMWYDFITVPSELLEYVETGINLPDVPDSIRKENDEIADPKAVEKAEETPTTPYKQTTGEGGEQNLPTDNTVLDYSEAGTDNFSTRVYMQGLR